jgi:hypothetical protein
MAVAIDGGFDLRTPVANAESVMLQFPQGKLLVVPGVGHSVTTADVSGCSQNYVRSWILGSLNAPREAQCSQRVQPLLKILGAFPRRPAHTAAATLAAAGKTLREAEATWIDISSPSGVERGLYGGTIKTLKNTTAFRLTNYTVAPGVKLSGKIAFATLGPPTTYKGTVRVSGPAAVAGTLTITKAGKITGKLGGRRVSARY